MGHGKAAWEREHGIGRSSSLVKRCVAAVAVVVVAAVAASSGLVTRHGGEGRASERYGLEQQASVGVGSSHHLVVV